MYNQVIETGVRTEYTTEFTATFPDNLTGPAARWPKTVSGNHIGAKARLAYRKFKLFRSARYPPCELAFQSPFKEAFVLSVAGYLAWTAGRAVRDATGKPLTAQFFELAKRLAIRALANCWRITCQSSSRQVQNKTTAPEAGAVQLLTL